MEKKVFSRREFLGVAAAAGAGALLAACQPTEVIKTVEVEVVREVEVETEVEKIVEVEKEVEVVKEVEVEVVATQLPGTISWTTGHADEQVDGGRSGPLGEVEQHLAVLPERPVCRYEDHEGDAPLATRGPEPAREDQGLPVGQLLRPELEDRAPPLEDRSPQGLRGPLPTRCRVHNRVEASAIIFVNDHLETVYCQLSLDLK